MFVLLISCDLAWSECEANGLVYSYATVSISCEPLHHSFYEASQGKSQCSFVQNIGKEMLHHVLNCTSAISWLQIHSLEVEYIFWHLAFLTMSNTGTYNVQSNYFQSRVRWNVCFFHQALKEAAIVLFWVDHEIQVLCSLCSLDVWHLQIMAHLMSQILTFPTHSTTQAG